MQLTPLGWAAGASTPCAECPPLAGPPDCPVPAAWHRPEDLLGDGDRLPIWLDASGHAHHLRQETLAAQPRQYAGRLAGYPVARFNPITGDHVQNLQSLWSLNPPYTIYCVARFLAYPYTQPNVILLDGGSADARLVADGTTLELRVGTGPAAGFSVAGGPYVPALAQVHEMAVDVSTAELLLNGISYGSANPGIAGDVGGLTLGTGWDATHPAEVEIAEVLVYGRLLDAGEQAAVRGYLAAKYSLPGSVPSVAGLVGWWHADLLLASLGSSDPVPTWPSSYPAAGSGADLVQASVPNQPAFNPSDIGARAVVQTFAGTQYLQSAGPNTGQPYTLILAGRAVSTGPLGRDSTTILDTETPGRIALAWTDADHLQLGGGSGPIADVTGIGEINHAIRLDLAGASSRLTVYWEGNTATASGTAPGGSFDGLTLSAAGDGSAPTWHTYGEIWLFDHLLTAAEWDLVQTYLVAKYNLS